MADPLQTNVQVQDIPEYLRDYRAALMNAAFLSVFNEPYLRQQFPKGQFSQLPGQPPPTAAATDQPPSGGGGTPPDNTRTGESPDQQGIAAALRSSRSRLPNLLGMVYDPKTRTYIPEAYQFITSTRMASGGSPDDEFEQLLEKYEKIRKNIPVGLTESLYDSQDKSKPDALTGAVTAPARKNPFGDLIGPAQTSLYTTGSSFGTALDRFNQPPDITSAPTPPIGTGVTAPPAPERFTPPVGIGVTLPLPPGRLSPPSPVAPPSTPGAPGSSAPAIPGLVRSKQDIAPIYSSGLAGTTQTPAGYNPAQYATDAQAKGIAKLLGGTTAATNVGGPNAPPPQNLINLGGSDVFNAGLVQQRLRAGQTPSEMAMSLQMMKDEVARSGGNTAEIDRMIQENNRAYASGAKTSPVGLGASSGTSSSASNASSNPAPATRGSMASNDTPSRGGTGRLSTSSSGRSDSSYQPPVQYEPPVQSNSDDGVPDWLKELEQKPAVPYFGRGFASGGSLAQFDIGDDGKVRNYRKGGAIRKQLGGGFNSGIKKDPDVFTSMGTNRLQNISDAIGGGPAVEGPIRTSVMGGDFNTGRLQNISDAIGGGPAVEGPIRTSVMPQFGGFQRPPTMQQPQDMYGGMPQFSGGMGGGMYGGMPQFGGMYGGMGGGMYGGMPQFPGMYGGMPQFGGMRRGMSQFGGMYGGMPQFGGGMGGMYGGMPQFGMGMGGMYGGMPQFGGMYGGGMQQFGGGMPSYGPPSFMQMQSGNPMFQGIGGFSGTANQMNSATVMPPNSQSNMQQGIGGLGMQQQPQPNQGFGMQQNKGSFGYSPGSRKMYSGGSVEEDEPIRLQTGGPSGPNISGVGFAAQPSMGGFQNLFGAANPNVNTSGIANIFNPPPVYGQQRIMQFGTTQNPLEFGQYAPGVGFKASDMTLDALRGAGKLPSIFDDKGQISAGTDFGKGVRSINFATDIAGESAAAGRDFLGQTMASPEQQSYLMSLMPGIREMGFKGPIKIDPLMAPTLQAPTGVTAANLKDYQMAEPMGVSGQNIDILGRLGGLNAAQVEGVPQVQQFQMQGPERVTGQTRDILSVLGDVSGSKVEGVPQVQQFQMGPAERVAAERTRVDAFGRPQAEQYMSPYMDAVTDVQKREATRQAAMQKAGRSAAAVRAGAFGGSRQAIQEGLAEEALQRQIGDIEATGRQRAFENAQAQFERDRAASLASQQANVQSGLQAALANQQAGVTTGRENLGALLATQQLGTQAGLQAALANQQAAQQAGLTKYGTRADILRSQSAQDLQAALANQQAGLTAGRENLGAQLATQQLGTQTALQAALANQQARQQAGLTQYGTTADILRGQSAQNLQAALANQQAGLTAGRENLAARLGTQQLAAQQALQAQLANQQAGLTAGQGNLQSALATQQLATQAGLEAAKASQSGDLATWQMQLDAIKQASAEQEAARQRGFQNRLAAMQQAQAGAAGLAGLGGTMMGIPGMAQQLELQRLAAMQQAGGAVDARTQQALDLAYQDFINQQNFPYQQMNFLQGILGGVPTGMQVEGVQFQRPAAGGLTGLIGAGAGSLLNYLNK